MNTTRFGSGVFGTRKRVSSAANVVVVVVVVLLLLLLLFLFPGVVVIKFDLRSAKAFSFHNRSSPYFACT